MGLQENLKIATQVAMEVRQKVNKSANQAWTSSPIIRHRGMGVKDVTTNPTAREHQGLVHNEVSNKTLFQKVRRFLLGKAPTNSLGWEQDFKKIKKLCYSHKVGNCGELAAIACLLLSEAGAGQVEYVQVWDNVTNNPALPHIIAVLDRQPGQTVSDFADVGKPEDWSADAVICDPWDRTAYPAHDSDFFWQGLRSVAAQPTKLTCKVLHQM